MINWLKLRNFMHFFFKYKHAFSSSTKQSFFQTTEIDWNNYSFLLVCLCLSNQCFDKAPNQEWLSLNVKSCLFYWEKGKSSLSLKMELEDLTMISLHLLVDFDETFNSYQNYRKLTMTSKIRLQRSLKVTWGHLYIQCLHTSLFLDNCAESIYITLFV